MTTDTPHPQDRLSAPSPGWYPDHTGRVRWWDGHQWTVALDETKPDRTWAVLSHLSLVVLPVIAPLVIRQTVGQRDSFVKHHATEALNVQILFVVVWNLLLGSLTVITATNPEQGPPGWMIALVFGLAFLGYGATVGFSIRAAVQASRDIWWRYPISIRLVQGSVKR